MTGHIASTYSGSACSKAGGGDGAAGDGNVATRVTNSITYTCTTLTSTRGIDSAALDHDVAATFKKVI